MTGVPSTSLKMQLLTRRPLLANHRNHRLLENQAMVKGMSASVIVPTHLPTDSLKPLLTAIYAESNSIHLRNLEVIVVCDYPDNGQQIPDFIDQNRTRILFTGKWKSGTSAARNRALKAATGDICVFVDSDCSIAPDFLWGHMVSYVDPDVMAAGGPIIFLPDGSFLSHVLESSSMLFPFIAPHFFETLTWSPSANISARREVAQQIMFDEGFPRAGGAEDIYFGLQLSRHGRFVSTPESFVEHPFWPSWKNVFQRFFRWGWGSGVLVDRVKRDGLIPIRAHVLSIATFFTLEALVPLVFYALTGRFILWLFLVPVAHIITAGIANACFILNIKGDFSPADLLLGMLTETVDRVLQILYDYGRILSCLWRGLVPSQPLGILPPAVRVGFSDLWETAWFVGFMVVSFLLAAWIG